MKRAPLSVCIVTAGEPTLEAAVASVREHVEEVCVLYTGLESRVVEVDSLADRFAFAPPAAMGMSAAAGQLIDFSAARNASFDLATQPWITWLDSDDVVRGAEHLDEVLGCASGHAHPRLIAPYEYRHDRVTGECDKLQLRERIVRNDGSYRWVHPVHETLVRVDGGEREDYRVQQPVVWVHRREALDADGKRNLRILLRAYDAAGAGRDEDAWLALQLGLELASGGQHASAIPHFERYLRLSRLDEERAWAMVQLSNAHVAVDPFLTRDDGALWWARQAIELRPESFQARLQLAKLHSMVGNVRGDEGALRQALREFRAAAALPPEETPYAVDPTERSYKVHDLARVDAETLGEWGVALEEAEAALLARPFDGPCRLAAKKYRARIRLDAAEQFEEERSGSREPQVTGGERAGLDVLVLCGDTLEQWNPEIAAARGIGGSETAVIEVSRRLARVGHRVRVFCNCGRPGEYDGVEYTCELERSARPDVLVAWRNAEPLATVRAGVKLLWVHDVMAHNLGTFEAHVADRVVAVSAWHARELVRRHEVAGLSAEKVVVLRNGIDPARFDQVAARVVTTREGAGFGDLNFGVSRMRVLGRNPRRVIYSSSPDRGLLQLLECWPAVREKVPDAELRVFYGAAGLRAAKKDWADRVAARLEEFSASGVTDVGKVDQGRLAREMLAAGVWAHPSWLPDGRAWTETSCISAQEALAAGLRCVVTAHGALPETVFEGTLVYAEGGEPDEAWREAYTGALVRALTMPEVGEREAVAAIARRTYDWDGVAAEWDVLIRKLAAEKAR